MQKLVLAATAVQAAVGAMVLDFASSADASIKHARKIGLTVEALQELQYAGERSGVAIGTTNTALQRMQRRISTAARGTGPAVEALAELGLNAQMLNRMQTDKQLEAIIGALNTKPESEWNRILAAIADIEGTEFAKLAKAGLPELRKLRQEAQDLGSVFSTEDAENAEAFDDALLNVQMAIKGIKNVIAASFLPALTAVLKEFKEFVVLNRELIRSNIVWFIDGLTRSFKYLASAMAVILAYKLGAKLIVMYEIIKKITLGIYGLRIATLAATASALILPIVVAAGVAAVLVALQDVYTYLNGGKSVTGLLVQKFKDAWDEIVDYTETSIELIKNSFKGMLPEWAIDLMFDAKKTQGGGVNTGVGASGVPIFDVINQGGISNDVPTFAGQPIMINDNRQYNYSGYSTPEMLEAVKNDRMQNNGVVQKDLSKGVEY